MAGTVKIERCPVCNIRHTGDCKRSVGTYPARKSKNRK